MNADVVYLDSSALVKLVIAEPESTALRRSLRRRRRRASCTLARIEVLRAVRPHGPRAMARARRLLQRIDLVQIDDELIEAASAIDSGVLRSLDAIHLAAARTLGDELSSLMTYDRQMAVAGDRLGFVIDAPR